MKTLYITAFLLAGIVSLHAQENKTVKKQDDTKAVKPSDIKLMQTQDSKKVEVKTSQLVSEQGLPQQKSAPKTNSQPVTNNLKDLPSAAILEK